MVKREDFYYESRDEKTKIHAIKWVPEEKPVAILQIVHGMSEYMDRYEEFAKVMGSYHILVTGDDHLGHGATIGENGIPGYFCKRDAATVVVRDVHRLKKTIQESYPDVPYFILGHSLGSFILRNYLLRYGTGIEGAIIMGTGMPSKGMLFTSSLLAKILTFFQGEEHPSKFLDQLAFSSYLKKIEHPKTEKDWLSKDDKMVEKYVADPLCGFPFTLNGFQTMFTLIRRLQNKKNLDRMPKELPVLFVSGGEDPVGQYGKDVYAVCKQFQEIGMHKIEVKIYREDRHELLNEINRELIYEELYQWIKTQMEFNK